MYRVRAGQPQTPVLKKLIRAMKSQHCSCGQSWKNLMTEIEQVSYMLREASLEA